MKTAEKPRRFTLSVAVTFARWSIRRGRPDRSWSASPAMSAYP